MVKILVAGYIASTPEYLLERVNKLHSSQVGPFDLLLSANVDPKALEVVVEKDLRFPLPFLFLADPANISNPIFENFSTGSEYSKKSNCTYLGCSGMIMEQGLRLAYFSSSDIDFSNNLEKFKHSAFLSENDNNPNADIFLLSRWPKGILSNIPTTESVAVVESVDSKESNSLLSVVEIAHPRYIFTSAPDVPFYVRPPFLDAHVPVVTRFLSIAPVLSSDEKGEKRSLYAFNCAPLTPDSEGRLPSLNENDKRVVLPVPYALPGGMKRSRLDQPPLPRSRPRMEPPSSSSVSSVPALNSNPPARVLPAEISRLLEADAKSAQSGPSWGNAAYRNTTNQYNSNVNNVNSDSGNRRRGRDVRVIRPPPPPPGPCWFCLSSPQVEKHLIVAVGLHSYLALPKGGITDTHALIIPIAHVRSALGACTPPATNAAELAAEINTFKRALEGMYAARGLVPLFMERVLDRQKRNLHPKNVGVVEQQVPLHTHIQAIGVPLVRASGVIGVFLQEGEARKVKFKTVLRSDGSNQSSTSITDGIDVYSQVCLPEGAVPSISTPSIVTGEELPTKEYLVVELAETDKLPKVSSESTELLEAVAASARLSDEKQALSEVEIRPAIQREVILHVVEEGSHHPVQFGRETLCKAMGLPDRMDWKKCSVSHDEEVTLTEAFKAEFDPFDFTKYL